VEEAAVEKAEFWEAATGLGGLAAKTSMQKRKEA
jgi:hypothetical protein